MINISNSLLRILIDSMTDDEINRYMHEVMEWMPEDLMQVDVKQACFDTLRLIEPSSVEGRTWTIAHILALALNSKISPVETEDHTIS